MNSMRKPRRGDIYVAPGVNPGLEFPVITGEDTENLGQKKQNNTSYKQKKLNSKKSNNRKIKESIKNWRKQ